MSVVDPHAIKQQYCAEDLGSDKNYARCNEPAEFILWGKLFKPEALGPRCRRHAAAHAGEHAIGWDLASWAIFDLRPVSEAQERAERAEALLDKFLTAADGSWCGCERTCGDDVDVDGPGVCRGLPRPTSPLVEIGLDDRRPATPKEGR